MSTIVILGSGFDIDLGLRISCADFLKSHYCPAVRNELWSAFENTLRDEVIQWYNNGMIDQKADDLNKLWQSYVKNISWFFTEQSDKFTINKNACAYRFLKRLKANSKSRVYTFNYTNPFDYVNIPQVKEFTYLHGRHYRDTFNKSLMVMSQGYNIILGIDECIPENGINNPKIYPLVKRHHPQYEETDIITYLPNAENVIFYGFSMGLMDSGYFRRFFKDINNGSTRCKKIYVVTYDKKGFSSFLSNIKDIDEDIGDISQKITIIPIYTSRGFKNRNFRMMLRHL